jgi:hypothetical protein
MEDFLDIRSSPKLSSALLLTSAFVHVISFSSTHWSDGGVFYTGLWKACILTPKFHCLQDPYTAGESTQIQTSFTSTIDAQKLRTSFFAYANTDNGKKKKSPNTSEVDVYNRFAICTNY